MTKMLVCKFRLSDGHETTIRTYRNETYSPAPEEIYSNLIANGAELLSYEWIDTLTELRKEWNREYPDLQIQLDT